MTIIYKNHINLNSLRILMQFLSFTIIIHITNPFKNSLFILIFLVVFDGLPQISNVRYQIPYFLLNISLRLNNSFCSLRPNIFLIEYLQMFSLLELNWLLFINIRYRDSQFAMVELIFDLKFFSNQKFFFEYYLHYQKLSGYYMQALSCL